MADMGDDEEEDDLETSAENSTGEELSAEGADPDGSDDQDRSGEE